MIAPFFTFSFGGFSYSFCMLQSGEINIKGLGKEGRTIRCPFCIGKKIKLHESRQLLQHAEGIWKSSKRKSKERGNHHALARYLKDTILDHVRVLGESSEPLMCYPWTGILVVKGLDKEGRFTKQYLTDKLKRFKPIDIVLLENKVAPTGEAIIKFHKDYDGYSRLLQFDTFYARERHGKKDYAEENNEGFNIYGWLASADDYDSSGVVGDYLRKTVQLKRFSDVVNEKEAEKKRRINELKKKIDEEEEIRGSRYLWLLSEVIQENNSYDSAYKGHCKQSQSTVLEQSYRSTQLPQRHRILLSNMRYLIETRANLPEFYRDEEDKIRKLQVMENSQFHKLLSVKAHSYNCCNTRIKALGYVYDRKSKSFKFGKRDEGHWNVKSRKKEESGEAVVEEGGEAIVEEGGEKEDGNDDGQRRRKTNVRKVKYMKFFTPLLEAWFYAKTGELDPSIGVAGSAPFVNFLGKIMYCDESSYLVNVIDESKLKECISGDNADNAHLKFNYRARCLSTALQEKLSVARNLGIEMSEEEILNDMRRNLSPQLLFSQESDANNTALIKAFISFPQTTRDAVDNHVSPAQKEKNLENLEHPVEDRKKYDVDEDEHPGSPSSNKEDQQVENAGNNKKQSKMNVNVRVEVEALWMQGPKLATVMSQVKKLDVSVLVLGQKKPSPLFTCLCGRSSTEKLVEECINNVECLTIGVGSIEFTQDAECVLGLHLLQFAEAIEEACTNLYPKCGMQINTPLISGSYWILFWLSGRWICRGI
ncbi:hypothetical protein POM88_033111 [Heracleum sosnowskyi]|uniref:Uncharacterized protein n=1 Tax=Heracleum sosnowskyi TaxID=360622 RepID=A0AAD8I2Y9_9APIA|nr:hypothetical protein POM88_033111 [Heracleum sosnowskyi]